MTAINVTKSDQKVVDLFKKAAKLSIEATGDRKMTDLIVLANKFEEYYFAAKRAMEKASNNRTKSELRGQAQAWKEAIELIRQNEKPSS